MGIKVVRTLCVIIGILFITLGVLMACSGVYYISIEGITLESSTNLFINFPLYIIIGAALFILAFTD